MKTAFACMIAVGLVLTASGHIFADAIPQAPGTVETYAVTNWGWYDEGGSRSLSIYNRRGDLIMEDGREPFMGCARLSAIYG